MGDASAHLLWEIAREQLEKRDEEEERERESSADTPVTSQVAPCVTRRGHISARGGPMYGQAEGSWNVRLQREKTFHVETFRVMMAGSVPMYGSLLLL